MARILIEFNEAVELPAVVVLNGGGEVFRADGRTNHPVVIGYWVEQPEEK